MYSKPLRRVGLPNGLLLSSRCPNLSEIPLVPILVLVLLLRGSVLLGYIGTDLRPEFGCQSSNSDRV